MKKVVLLLALILVAIIAIGCSNEPSCEEQLQEFYAERSRALNNCGPSFSCAKKVQAEFDEKEKQILENCN